jgi:predicted acyltransferase
MDVLLINDINANIMNFSDCPPPPAPRIITVDIFRGLSIAFMILINTQAYFSKIYPMFEETEWNGLSFADCIFPGFLFIMGYSIILSNRKSKCDSLRKALKRFIILIFIGLCLNLFENDFAFTNIRIPSVLFRLALLYTICNICYLIHFKFLGIFSIGMIILYYFSSYRYNVPHCGRGVLTQYCFAGGYFDRIIFGSNHIMYPTDPEGLLSSCTALYTVFSGFGFASILKNASCNSNRSQIINSNKAKRKAILNWLLISCINLTFGLIIFFLFEVEFNKKIYSLSFTFLVSSICGFFFIILFILFDLFEWIRIRLIFSTFIWMSHNSLLIYISHILMLIGLDKIKIDNRSLIYWCWTAIYDIIDNKKLSTLIIGLLHLIIWKVFAAILYRKKIFFRI